MNRIIRWRQQVVSVRSAALVVAATIFDDVKVTEVEWDKTNRKHVQVRNRCSETEVEDVLLSRCYRSRFKSQPTEGGNAQRIAVGQACSTKFLAIPFDVPCEGVARPRTCVWPGDAAVITYLAWRQTVKR